MRLKKPTLVQIAGGLAILLLPLPHAAAGFCATKSPQLIKLGDAYYAIDEPARTRRQSDRRDDNHVDTHGLNRISRLAKVNRIAESRAARLKYSQNQAEINPEAATLLAALQSMSFKSGSGTRLTCLHTSPDEDRSVRRERDVESSINSTFTLTDLELHRKANGNYILKAYAEDDEKIVSQRVDLPSADHWKSDPTDASHITVSEKYRRRNFNDGVNEPHIFESLISDEGVSTNPAINNPLVPHASTAGAHLVEVQLSMSVSNGGIEINRVVYINGYWAEALRWNLGS